MKPHEETWSANVKGAAMICNEDGRGHGVFMFHSRDHARARLAAQAPAMARAILEIVGDEPITAMTRIPTVEQMRRLQTVLFAAGVIPLQIPNPDAPDESEPMYEDDAPRYRPRVKPV